MKVLEVPDYFGYSIFCDDVRQEIGGKATFIGVYRAVIFVHESFPAVIPKFVIAINFFQRKSAVRDNAKVRIYLPGEEEDYDKPAQIEGVIGGLQEGAEKITTSMQKIPGADTSFMRIESPLVFTPLILAEPGLIKVRVILDDELVIRIGQLQVLPGDALSALNPTPPAA